MPKNNVSKQQLNEWGYFEQPNGTWAKRKPVDAKLGSSLRQHSNRKALDGVSPPKKRVRHKLSDGVNKVSPEWAVLITCFSPTPKDSDNIQVKYLRDEIARWIGLDDADRFISWEVHSVKSVHKGTSVIITKL